MLCEINHPFALNIFLDDVLVVQQMCRQDSLLKQKKQEAYTSKKKNKTTAAPSQQKGVRNSWNLDVLFPRKTNNSFLEPKLIHAHCRCLGQSSSVQKLSIDQSKTQSMHQHENWRLSNPHSHLTFETQNFGGWGPGFKHTLGPFLLQKDHLVAHNCWFHTPRLTLSTSCSRHESSKICLSWLCRSEAMQHLEKLDSVD